MKLRARLPFYVLPLILLLPGPSFARTSRKPAKTLAATIDTLLADPSVSRAHWGISVITAAGKPVFALNDGQLFQPASNAKIFTTATAFAVFSPDARFHTSIAARGTIDSQGTLNGDLLIEGHGDPSLSGRAWPYAEKTERPDPPLHALDELATQVAQNGKIRRITGRIVGDDTWFPLERYGSGWSWDDLQWDYGAPVSALTVNDNVIYLDILPGAKPGDPVATAWNPAVPYYALETTAITTAAGTRSQLGVNRQPGSKTVRLYGSIPAGSNGEHLALAIEDPAEFAALAFRQMLLARGIQVDGAAAAEHSLPTSTEDFLAETRMPLTAPLVPGTALATPNTGEVLAAHDSPPLNQDLTVINKVSQNLHAELLLHDLGKAVLNDGSTAAGARVVRQFLIAAGVDPSDFIFFDGSGLSPDDLVTPRAATTLLAYAARQPWGEAFRATLPIAGIDGTLAGRFLHSPVKGKLSAKTGTLGEVNTLSGYLLTAKGHTLILSILCNGHDPSSHAERKAIDSIVEAAYARE